MRWFNWRHLDLNHLFNEKKVELDFNGIMLLWGASSAVTYIVVMIGEHWL